MPTPNHLIVHGAASVAHHLPSRHPLKPHRADDAVRLLLTAGMAGAGAAVVREPQPASDEDLKRVHDETYVSVAERLSRAPEDPTYLEPTSRDAVAHGFSPSGDNPPYREMAAVARHACGGVIQAARHVLDHTSAIAFVPSAGANHHAMRTRASGFGVYNDAAVAIAAIRSTGARVAYVDLDVHHGDGVEAAFATDPGTLTVSLHESTRYLFPGLPAGLADHIGTGDGAGFAVNVPLSPYTNDAAWLAAFESIVPPLLMAFQADLIIVQCGADGYHADPLAHLLLSEFAYISAASRLRELSGGRLVMIGGGGYDADATSRIWAAMFATATGVNVPREWVTNNAPTLDDRAAARVTAENNATVATVQGLVFPRHGLSVPGATDRRQPVRGARTGSGQPPT
ncbi:MAG: acetoin utilization protein AcuC [Chloroflexi bacterium]|nr:acetoin utilization protein AcuC [Chloroflexota bacterium]